MTPEGIRIHKAAVPAWSFIAQQDTEDFFEEHLPAASMALLHTRFATIGSPDENANNHPFFVGNTAIVHNGSISNHTHLFSSNKLDRSCETDSDIIRALLDKEGINEEGIKALNTMSGSAAICAFSLSDPDKLLLARSGSPLMYGTSPDKLWWASDLQSIQKAVRPWVARHGLLGRQPRTDVAYHTLPDNTAYILSTNGMDLRREMKTCLQYRAPHYACNTNYASKQKQFKEEKARNRNRRAAPVVHTIPVPGRVVPLTPYTKKSAVCPHKDCDTVCIIARDKKWVDFTCPTCKKTLALIDQYTNDKVSLTK
jgi:predicted glutamine amidotransferase